MLEIGIGTGKAAGPILEKQCHLTALEPGEQLADITKKKFQQYDNFVLHNQMLQDYVCPPETYDLIYSATAFHWIPEEYGYTRVYGLLKNGGVISVYYTMDLELARK